LRMLDPADLQEQLRSGFTQHLNKAAQDVWAALEAEPQSIEKIMGASGRSDHSVRLALTEFTASGLAEKVNIYPSSKRHGSHAIDWRMVERVGWRRAV